MDVQKAQAALGQIVAELRQIDTRLGALAEALPPSRDEERMLEGEIASDLATEVRGAIGYCREDQLRQLIEFLGAAAAVTAEELASDFARRLARDETPGVH
ncbi:MAG: hypothetical protein AAF657_23355 [Acidobacteriota bacterium]